MRKVNSMAERKPAMKGTQKSKKSKGFTAEEREAMKARGYGKPTLDEVIRLRVRGLE